MKNSFLPIMGILGFICIQSLCSGSNSNILFSDDFSIPNAWHQQGNGDVNVSSGKCNFNNVYSGDYNRVYRNIGQSLPSLYWRAECEFTILNENPMGNGTGEVVLALTCGTLDFMSYNIQQSYEETFQDGIAVVLMSDNSGDNDINNWYFMIEGKKGDIRTFDILNTIHAQASISKYFLRLERTSVNSTQLSIFSDSAYSQQLPGSPVVFEIDPTIDRLNTIQHGTMTPGFYSRLINANLDNDVIYDDSFFAGLTSFNPFNQNAFSVYPNPATSILNVKSTDATVLQSGNSVRIFTLAGAEITRDILTPSKQIDISRLMQGAFLLMISSAEKTLCTRFVKTE
jgi:hypothetical protein